MDQEKFFAEEPEVLAANAALWLLDPMAWARRVVLSRPTTGGGDILCLCLLSWGAFRVQNSGLLHMGPRNTEMDGALKGCGSPLTPGCGSFSLVPPWVEGPMPAWPLPGGVCLPCGPFYPGGHTWLLSLGINV